MNGNKIILWCHKRNITPAELARAVNANQSTISRLISGKMELTQEWCHKLAPVLRCKPADLLADADIPISKKLLVVGEVAEKGIVKFYPAKEYKEIPDQGFGGVDLTAVKLSENLGYPPYYRKGDLLFYDRGREFNKKLHLGRLCLVELSPQKTVIGEVSRGRKANTFTIRPLNQAAIEDVKILSAYKIEFAKFA